MTNTRVKPPEVRPAKALIAVDACAGLPTGAQRDHALLGPAAKALEVTNDDRVGRAGLGAGRLQRLSEPIHTEGTLVRAAVAFRASHHAERTGGHAVATAVADVIPHQYRPVVGLHDGPGRAGLETPGDLAVFADIGQEEPSPLAGRGVE
jgi:hypothetical protein